MWTRCFPAMRKVRDLIASGSIGDISVVQGDFGWSTKGCQYPEDRIWNDASGGMTLDVGMYMAQLGGVAFPNASVNVVQSLGSMKNGVDHTVLTNVRYNKSNLDGQEGTGMLQFYVTGDANTEERVVIQGTRGRIVLDSPAHVPDNIRVYYDKGRGSASEEVLKYPLPDDSHETWNYPRSIGFTYQIQEVNEALRNGEKECRHFTWNDSLQVASILDQVLEQVHGEVSYDDIEADDNINEVVSVN